MLNSTKFARKLMNILPLRKKAGAGGVRFGMGRKGDAAPQDALDAWEFLREDGSLETLHLGMDFTLRRFDEALDTYVDIKSGISPDGLMGATQINGKLVFFNGVDPNFSYDGATIVDIGEYVEDRQASAYTWISSNSFSLKPNPARNDYPNGRKIRLDFATAGLVEAVIQSSNLVAGVLTVVVVGTPFPVASEQITSVEYFDNPPPFSFITTANDKLWALSGGISRPKVRRGKADSMKVFYTVAENNENAWFDQGTDNSTQEVAYLNIRNKANIFDELIAVTEYNGFMVFFGRLKTYLWQGYDPGVVGAFIPATKLDIGLVHQKLFQAMPNDVAFVSPFGLRTLSVQTQTKGVQVTNDIGSAQDGDFAVKIAALNAEDTAYRKARSCFYQRDGLFIFKLDDVSALVYVLNDKAKGWTEFNGYFSDASAFVPLSDQRLMIVRGSQAYIYANGEDALVGEAYSDDGQAISALWWIPWQSRGARWSNKAIQILLEDTVPSIMIKIDRMLDYNELNVVTLQLPVSGGGAQWDGAQWDVDKWDAATTNPVVSDKFLADQAMSLRISFDTTEGPVNLLGCKPIGR